MENNNLINLDLHNNLRKAHITEAFGYGQDKITFPKTGKEIKDKLSTTKEKCSQEVNKLQMEYSLLKDKINEEPTEEISEYYFNGTKDKFSSIPKVFEYKYLNKIQDSSMDLNLSTPTQSEDISKLKDKYNSLVHKYIKEQAEVYLIETLIENLTDTLSYNLTLNQLTTLGF